MHFDEAITRALKGRKFEDARKLEIEKTEPGYETSEALSDEVRPRLEYLQALLTTRLVELADNREIDNYNFVLLRIFSIISIYWQHISQLSISLLSANSTRRVVSSV